MKIAFVHPAYMDYRQKLFEQLHEKYDITFIFTKQGRGQNDVKENHLEIPPTWKHKILKSDFLIAGKDLIMNLKLINEIIFGEYDIVMTSTSRYTCYLAARLKKSKFIFINEFWHFESKTLVRTILNLLTKIVFKNSDAIISMGLKSSQILLSWGVDPERIYSHPQCAVDYTSIVSSDSSDIRKKYGLNDKKVILFVGRFVEFKGVEYLIQSFSILEQKLDNSCLIIGGRGYLEDKYLKLIKDLKIKNILFITDMNDYDKANLYNICNVFVLPSIYFSENSYEAWGLVINEALAFGKPVVTTDAVGSGYDLVKNGINGFVVKNKDIEELQYAIYRILTDEKLEFSMGKASKEIFDNMNNYSNFFSVFEKAIDNI